MTTKNQSISDSCPGALFIDSESRYWIKLAPNDLHYLREDALVNLFTGEINYAGNLSGLRSISHLEIMW